jgi:hypothetical protein
VYADYLDERGDPRGEFVRVQVDLARLPKSAPRRTELEARERQLLEQHERQWLGRRHSPLLHWRFRRGFVEAFAHDGVFQTTEPLPAGPDDDLESWDCLRFYDDGTVLQICSIGTPSQVAPWFHRGHHPGGRPEPPSSRYTLQWTRRAVELSFGFSAWCGLDLGPLAYEGSVEVEPDLFGTGLSVRLMMDVSNQSDGQTTRRFYRLVDVPGLDSSQEVRADGGDPLEEGIPGALGEARLRWGPGGHVFLEDAQVAGRCLVGVAAGQQLAVYGRGRTWAEAFADAERSRGRSPSYSRPMAGRSRI